jgi:hypothetical protein
LFLIEFPVPTSSLRVIPLLELVIVFFEIILLEALTFRKIAVAESDIVFLII